MTGKAIYNILKNNTEVNNLVQGKIYPNRLPQSIDLPAVVYTFVSNNPLKTKDITIKFETKRVQISVIAASYADVNTISEKVTAALHGYKGIIEGVNVDMIAYDNDTDLYDDETEVNMKAIDFKVIIKN